MMKVAVPIIAITFFLLSDSFSAEAQSADCGKLLNSVLKYDPVTKKADFLNFFFIDEDFCDAGKNEYNANFKIVLYDKSNAVLSQKLVFLNTMTVLEPLNGKNSAFLKSKIIRGPQYRNVKFAVKNKEIAGAYKIYSLGDKKLLGEGVVK